MRKSEISRKTRETEIVLSLDLDGGESCGISTGCGFFDHMLTLFACHSGFGLSVDCRGDTGVDYHHTVEDVGIVLGEAFAGSIGEKAGICRYGSIALPMDGRFACSGRHLGRAACA